MKGHYQQACPQAAGGAGAAASADPPPASVMAVPGMTAAELVAMRRLLTETARPRHAAAATVHSAPVLSSDSSEDDGPDGAYGASTI